MIVGIDDLVMSVRAHILDTSCEMKTGTAFTTQSMKAAWPALVVLARDLEFNPETYGPRVGIVVGSAVDDGFYYGDAFTRHWDLLLEVDALMKGPTGKVDPDLTVRTMWALETCLRQLFRAGRAIDVHIWRQSGAAEDAGACVVENDPVYEQVDVGTFAFAVRLQKVVRA